MSHCTISVKIQASNNAEENMVHSFQTVSVTPPPQIQIYNQNLWIFFSVVQTVIPFLVARFDHQSMKVTLKIHMKFVLLFLNVRLLINTYFVFEL